MTTRGDNAAMMESRTSTDTTGWQVLGTGAMACLWASTLVEGGHAVRMIPRELPDSPMRRSILLSGVSSPTPRRVELTLEGREASPIHRLLVCTKATDVEQALGGVAHRLAPGAAVVLLQNGMGFQETARGIARDAEVFCAVTTEGAYLEAPFTVRHAGRGRTDLGYWPSGNVQAAQAIAKELGTGFLPVQAVDAIEPLLWRKLAVNCAINPLTALQGCTNGELLEPAYRPAFDALCGEIARVLRESGRAELADRLAADAEAVARATAQNRSSMRQDLEGGRRTEIAFINGFLIAYARKHGISCPLNAALVDAIRAREGCGGSTV